MKNRILIGLILLTSVFNVYSQRSITQDEYQKIITTDAYYWGRSDFYMQADGADAAKAQAREELINQIAEFEKSINKNELINRANCVKFEVEGDRTRIIFYIAKDSLYIERTVETILNKENKTEPVKVKEAVKEPVVEKPKEVVPVKASEPTSPVIETKLVVTEVAPVKVESGNEIINTLSQISDFNNFCIQLNRYKRQGKLFDSQSGAAPDALENCIMAVFKNDILEALYDKGNISRKDFLSKKTTQKPEDNYKNDPQYKVIFIKLN